MKKGKYIILPPRGGKIGIWLNTRHLTSEEHSFFEPIFFEDIVLPPVVFEHLHILNILKGLHFMSE